MALTLYGVYRSRASRNLWLLGELGARFKHVPVIQAYRLPNPKAKGAPLHTASKEFRAVNPNGLVPALVDGKLVLNESLAINLYIAKKLGGRLAPKDLKEDALMTMWAVWAVTECEPQTIKILQNTVGKPEPERDPEAVKAATEALKRPFDVLEAHLAASGGFMVGKRFTVADINTAEVLRYAQGVKALFAKRPHLKAWIESCQARPAYQAMMAKRAEEPA